MENQVLLREILECVFRKNRLENFLTDDIVDKFGRLTDMMLEINRVMNITAITAPDKIIPLHYADCLLAAKYIPEGAKVADIGCGGGFPILPLAIARPDLQLIGIDSTEKKVRYVQAVADTLELNVATIAGRAEDLAVDKMHREGYDVVISRAVARMNVLDELCLPLVKIGGTFLAMKGARGEEEALEAQNGVERLGGRTENIESYTLFTEHDPEKRTLIAYTKIRETPLEFPRSFGSIKKRPL